MTQACSALVNVHVCCNLVLQPESDIESELLELAAKHEGKMVAVPGYIYSADTNILPEM